MKRNGKLREIKIINVSEFIRGEVRDDNHEYTVYHHKWLKDGKINIRIAFNMWGDKNIYVKRFDEVTDVYENRQGIINQIIDEMKKHYEF